MRPELFRRVEFTRQLCFGQGGVDFAVANVVHQDRWPALAAFELWYQVVQALGGIRGDWTVTEWANRIWHLLSSLARMAFGMTFDPGNA